VLQSSPGAAPPSVPRSRRQPTTTRLSPAARAKPLTALSSSWLFSRAAPWSCRGQSGCRQFEKSGTQGAWASARTTNAPLGMKSIAERAEPGAVTSTTARLYRPISASHHERSAARSGSNMAQATRNGRYTPQAEMQLSMHSRVMDARELPCLRGWQHFAHLLSPPHARR